MDFAFDFIKNEGGKRVSIAIIKGEIKLNYKEVFTMLNKFSTS